MDIVIDKEKSMYRLSLVFILEIERIRLIQWNTANRFIGLWIFSQFKSRFIPL